MSATQTSLDTTMDSSASASERTQVLVVGAGPVGAVAAFALAKAGIDVRLVEAGAACATDMRASTLHPPTLDMLRDLGLLDTLEAQGLRAPVYQYRNRASSDILNFDLGELADVSDHPYRLQCEQFKLARLATGLLGTNVRFGERVVFVEQDGRGVRVHVERALDVKTYQADYVIAADGANSLIRKIAGIAFDGFTYPERFLTLSTQYPMEDHFVDLAKVSYIADESEWYVLLRVPDFWRILVPAAGTESDADLLGDAKKTAVLAGILKVEAAAITTHHRTVYRVHQRVAQRYNHGRVLLVGDAAHLNNPLGGFGMNSGLHDAWNLVEKLTRILHDGEAAAPLLDLYDRQRRTIMHDFVQAQTMRNKAEMLTASQRQAKYEAILADPEARRDFLLTQSMYDSRKREAAIA